jgi:uncharacterized membrane protein
MGDSEVDCGRDNGGVYCYGVYNENGWGFPLLK